MSEIAKTKTKKPHGNLKWTVETVSNKVDEMMVVLKNNPDDYNFLGTLLIDLGLYREIWGIWKRKFSNEVDLFSKMKLIDSVFEAKIVEAGMKGKLNPTLVIFALKNNYGWRDKKEIDLSGSMSISNMSSFVEGEEDE